MADTIIPPWMRPVSPLGLQLIDDQTAVFTPRFGRNRMQRAKFSDPRWGATLRFEGMRDYERAALRRVLLEARGRSGSIWWGPGVPQRGSFPAPELLANNDFSNGTTGWTFYSVSGPPVTTVSDRVLRIAAHSRVGNYGAQQTGLVTVQYTPYVARAFFPQTNMPAPVAPFSGRGARLDDTALAVAYREHISAGYSQASAVLSTASNAGGFWQEGSATAGQFYEVSYSSISRCALVDGGANAVNYSNSLANAAWGKNLCTVLSNWSGHPAPDGTFTANHITPSDPSHYVAQAFTTPAANADYFFTVALRAWTRGFAQIQLNDFAIGGVWAYVNLTTGAVTSSFVSGAWSNLRSAVVDLGDGWWQVSICARKISGITQVVPVIVAADSDGVPANAGTILAWRPTGAAGSAFGRLIGTDAASQPSGVAQTGSTIPLKGLPASTNGLLLAGDFVQVNGQLVQLVAPLDSNAAGQGTMVVAPAVLSAPDNTPVIINNPMGRFMLANDPQITERYGLYTDAELELVEVFS